MGFISIKPPFWCDTVDGSEILNNHRLDGVLYPIDNGISTTIPSTGEWIPDFWSESTGMFCFTFSIHIEESQIQSPQTRFFKAMKVAQELVNLCNDRSDGKREAGAVSWWAPKKAVIFIGWNIGSL